MDIIILGSKGMLGQMVTSYFSSIKKYNILVYDEHFSHKNYFRWGSFIHDYPNAVIINCIGKIKQKSDDLSELTFANSILPLAISSLIGETNYFVHASTDCVFDGKKGSPYLSSDLTNAIDGYGWSKRIGEIGLMNNRNILIPRVSIIGPNNSQNATDLLSWFMKNPSGSQLTGFVNHLWNGITTLEWAKQIEKLVINRNLNGIVHLGSEQYYSKYEMLLLFAQYFRKDFTILAQNHPEEIDRRLKPDIVCSSLENQMSELIKNKFIKYT